MSGFEVFGAVAAAVTLVDLARKYNSRLEKIHNVHQDIATLRQRIVFLTQIVTQISTVLQQVRRPRDEHVHITEAEVVLWRRMDAVLRLCHQKLEGLKIPLDQVPSHNRRSRLSAALPDIERRTRELDWYIQSLDQLKSLFQIISQHQQSLVQQAIRRDISDIKASQGDHENRMDTILRCINDINDRLFQQDQQRLPRPRSDSLLSSEPNFNLDDKVDSLSMHLNEIVIAATDVKASFSNAPTSLIPLQSLGILPDSSPPSSSSSNVEALLKGSLADITHVEPLKELAQRFKRQAEHDLEHDNYKDAEFHLLESIECFKELHDAHSILFDAYYDMQMQLFTIYQKLQKYDDARQILRRASNEPFAYDRDLGWKKIPPDLSDGADHRAANSHDMANLLLEEFAASSESVRPTMDCSPDSWATLYEAESHAKRAFRLRRDRHERDDETCKESALLLVNIYTKFGNKHICAETYTHMYILDDDHRKQLLTILSGSSTSRSRSVVLADPSSLIDVVKDHDIGAEYVCSIMNSASLVELEHTKDGRSIMMIAMDCHRARSCDRCDIIVDKLLRLSADRDTPFAYAIKKQRIADCERLHCHGANINWHDGNGITPLMHAIKQDSIGMVSYLLSKDPDVNAKGERGQSALHYVTHTQNEEIFKMLLQIESLDIDAVDERGMTALHHCAKQDNTAFAKCLDRAGADLEIKDKSGSNRTPLWIAIREDKYNFANALLKVLLKKGAQVDMAALPEPRSRDVRNLLNRYTNRNASSRSAA